MKFGKSILSPSYFRKPDFDSHNSTERKFIFECVNCKTDVEIKYKSIIGKEYSWREDFDQATINEIKHFYNFNEVNKTPDGGWTAITKYHCRNCQAEYLIYAGVNEYYNGLYKVTLQAITEILEDESDKNTI